MKAELTVDSIAPEESYTQFAVARCTIVGYGFTGTAFLQLEKRDCKWFINNREIAEGMRIPLTEEEVV